MDDDEDRIIQDHGLENEQEDVSMEISFIDLVSDDDDDDDVIYLTRDTRDQEYEDDEDEDDVDDGDQDALMDIPVIDLVSDDDDDDADTVILEPEELVRRVEDADFYNCSYTPSERSRRGRICRDPMWSQDYLFY
ncbi:pheromone-processing carboxypeptidase KEX1-like [Aphidius gifuensis]|uniref:pheromone-processing carboxypeptidase KEX1-like n=1 Tax=Aphidius gifuensis TaxID=684658 RepID=UPI001CDCB1C1|nr:pheromone-processing carboxypeptidase KEX1-like [Aphidius gifuensis]